MRAAARGNQHVFDLIRQRAAYQGHIARRACQHFGGGDAQRIELARPIEQQQIRFISGDGFREIGPRLMCDVHLRFVTHLLTGAQRAQAAAHLSRLVRARTQRLIGRHANHAHQHHIGGQQAGGLQRRITLAAV